jgi:outer membrane autotransporter protein
VAYGVAQEGSDYFLTAALTPTGFEPLSIATLVPDLWYPSADEVIANLAVPYKGEGLGVWAQGYGAREKFGDDSLTRTIAGVDYTIDQHVKVSRLGIQAGVDYGVGGTGRVGITGGFGTHRYKGLSELDADGWNLGAYGSFGGVTGFHGELLAKYDRYRVKFREGLLDDMSTHVRSTGVDGSVGYRMPMGSAENASVDLAVGLSHVWNKIDSFDAFGLNYDYDGADSTRGRASARWNAGGDLQPYVQGTVYHEFADAGSVVLNDGVNDFALDAFKRGTWGRIEAGIGGSPGRFPTFAAWADVGDVKGIGARLGFRFGGHAEPMAPPPPVIAPPPAEPAPATQTCYDGSVILATDTCPVPPPPPPPAATPERG